jgi:hypothetical protein
MHEKETLFPIANSHGRLESKDIWEAPAIDLNLYVQEILTHDDVTLIALEIC